MSRAEEVQPASLRTRILDAQKRRDAAQCDVNELNARLKHTGVMKVTGDIIIIGADGTLTFTFTEALSLRSELELLLG